MSAQEQPQMALLLQLAELVARVYDLGIRPIGTIVTELFTRSEVVVLLRANAGRAWTSVEALIASLAGVAQR
jgi:translation initiation factor IF-2